jgi:hypothetical protein
MNDSENLVTPLCERSVSCDDVCRARTCSRQLTPMLCCVRHSESCICSSQRMIRCVLKHNCEQQRLSTRCQWWPTTANMVTCMKQDVPKMEGLSWKHLWPVKNNNFVIVCCSNYSGWMLAAVLVSWRVLRSVSSRVVTLVEWCVADTTISGAS